MRVLQLRCGILFIVFCVYFLEGAKVKSRFDMPFIKTLNQRILVFEASAMMMINRNERSAASFAMMRFLSSIHREINYTMHRGSLESGTADAFGNYSEMIGMIQRGEADYAMQLVRADSLPFEPIYVGGTLLDASFSIVSGKPSDRQIDIDVFYVFRNFSPYVLQVFFITSFVTIVLISMTTSILSIPVVELISDFPILLARTVWNIYMGLVDQENYNLLRSLSSILLWTHFMIAIFVLVFGFFCNCMSTDLVVQVEPPMINNVKDLFTETFSHVKPTLLRNQYLHAYLLSQPKSTIYSELLDRVMHDKAAWLDSGVLANGASGMASTLNIIDSVERGQRALLAPLFLIDIVCLPLVCLKSKNFEYHKSNQLFGSGTASAISSKGRDIRWKRYIEYGERVALESGWLLPTFSKLVDVLTEEQTGSEPTIDNRKCVEGFIEERDKVLPVLIISACRRLLDITFYGFLTSAIVV